MRTFNGAVLGSPISHSLSPVIHQVAYECLEISAKYTAVEVKGGKSGQVFGIHTTRIKQFFIDYAAERRAG
jgi:shikimate 5-dehydrogenase